MTCGYDSCEFQAIDYMIIEVDGEKHIVPICEICYHRAMSLSDIAAMQMLNAGKLKETANG